MGVWRFCQNLLYLSFFCDTAVYGQYLAGVLFWLLTVVFATTIATNLTNLKSDKIRSFLVKILSGGTRKCDKIQAFLAKKQEIWPNPGIFGENPKQNLTKSRRFGKNHKGWCAGKSDKNWHFCKNRKGWHKKTCQKLSLWSKIVRAETGKSENLGEQTPKK